jgi:hypothetical protein
MGRRQAEAAPVPHPAEIECEDASSSGGSSGGSKMGAQRSLPAGAACKPEHASTPALGGISRERLAGLNTSSTGIEHSAKGATPGGLLFQRAALPFRCTHMQGLQ